MQKVPQMNRHCGNSMKSIHSKRNIAHPNDKQFQVIAMMMRRQNEIKSFATRKRDERTMNSVSEKARDSFVCLCIEWNSIST